MHSRVKVEIIALAEQRPTEEICGFVYADKEGLKALPCRNVATDPTQDFEIDKRDHVRALQAGRVFGIYHSHPDDSSFSPADLACAERSAYPLYLYSVGSKIWADYLPPTYKPPLVGRSWALGTWDCYGIVRDYYRTILNHHLSDYDRDESFCHEEQQVIMNNFEKEGFDRVELSVAVPHDVLLFRTEKALPQHFGILTGKQRMLHHPQNGLSGEEILTGRWLNRAVCAFRMRNRPVLV